MSDNNWFSQAGSLDDSLDNSNTHESTTTASVPIVRESVESRPASSSSATFIKPVKGLKDNPAGTVSREPAPVYTEPAPVYTEPAPVKTVSAKEENRCRTCGAVIPEGTTQCWNCYSAEKNAVEKGVLKTPNLISTLKKHKLFIIIGAAATVTLIVFCIFAFSVFGHKLSGKYSYVENGYNTEISFSSNGTLTWTSDNSKTLRGTYYWNSSEKRFYIELPGENWWGGNEVIKLTAEKKFAGLRISVKGQVYEFKKV